MRNVHLREALFACLALSLAGAGLVVDLASRRPASAGLEVAASAGAPARFHERSVFCPGARGRDASGALSVHTPRSRGIRVAARPWNGDPAPVDGKMLWLPRAGRRAVNVVGSGGRVTAASLVGWRATHGKGREDATAPDGAGASGCSSRASEHWYFPLGASSAGWDERITILNPFPDTAIARVHFASGRGVGGQDPHEVAVPARTSVQVEVNRVALPDPSLAATVTVRRGRVVAWKTIFRNPRIERSSQRLAHLSGRSPKSGPAAGGALFSLGASGTSARWYFPEAGAGPGRSTTLALMNPGKRPAAVTVSLLGRRAIVQPPRLADVAVPAGGSKSVDLRAPAARRGPVRSFGAVVASTDDVRVVAERSMSYTTAGLEGVASEIGAPGLARRWSLAPAAARPAADDVIVLNPGSKDAVVDLTVFRPSRPGLAPPRLQGLVVEGGSRSTIAVGGRPGHGPGVVLARSSALIAAERRAYSPDHGDVASIMGQPLPLRAN
ncbi:MAG: hypothetical protein H0W55_09450 [Actinobacteria bacterium]|nr:hypothetical protein [Actinomycetota bacterium]